MLTRLASTSAVVTLLVALASPAHAQVFIDESFDTGVGAWTITNGGSGADTWFWNDLAFGHFTNVDGTPCMLVDSDWAGDNENLNETLTSPAFDTSLAPAVLLTFDTIFNTFIRDIGTVEVFDGLTWHEVARYDTDVGMPGFPAAQAIDITAFANPAMQVRFYYDDQWTWGWHWAIDNVLVEVPVGPEIDVQRPAGASIAVGNMDYLTGLNEAGFAVTPVWTIENAALVDPLNIYSTVVVPGSPTNCAATVTVPPAAVTVAGDFTTFEVEIIPTAVGPFSFDVEIANDDDDDDPYTFTVTGSSAGNAVITPGNTFVQDFEPATFLNYAPVFAGPFPRATSYASTALDPAPSTIAGGARIALYDENLPNGLILTPSSGLAQVGIDYPPDGPEAVGAIDLFYDMSALDPAAAAVELEFGWASLGSDDHAEDIVTLSRDGGATWEAILFEFPSDRSPLQSYHFENIDLSPVVAGLPGGNFTDQMVIRIQEADNFGAGSDGLVIDDVVVTSFSDVDGDGVLDAPDNCPVDSNATQDDGDGDGAGDVCDLCPLDIDPLQTDVDADGVGDVCDMCPFDPDDDSDVDGVCGDTDNCPLDPNPTQDDSDSDGIGDLCDFCPLDPDDDGDADGVCGDADNCPNDTNSGQTDSDADGAGDACDGCALDADNDADGDGACGDADNCPNDGNADQEDADDDGTGDVCDVCPDDDLDDIDGDGLCAGEDNCPLVDNANQADDDGDGLGDACSPAEKDSGGCGCTTSPASSAPASLALGLLLALVRRRRQCG